MSDVRWVRRAWRRSGLVGLGALAYHYRARLRVDAPRELLAGAGVATAVALVFATLVAAGSVANTADQVIQAVVGPASLQVRARGGEGMPEDTVKRVEELAGVERAAPLLEQTATIAAPNGRSVTVDVAGTTYSLALLNGLAHKLPIATFGAASIGISQDTGRALAIGASSRQLVSLRMRGSRWSLHVSAVLGPETFGALSKARVAVLPLETLQRLAGLPGRISRVLVQTQPGQTQRVRRQLQSMFGSRLSVVSATEDETLLRRALAPSNQASGLFAAISGLLGFLFAFTAMLLTVPARRAAIADKRIEGVRRSALVQMVVFQALCLATVASAVGVGAGLALSSGVFTQSPGYLARAFTLGAHTEIGAVPLVLAIVAGLAATCLASMLPLVELRRKQTPAAHPLDADSSGNTMSWKTQRQLALVAVTLAAMATALLEADPAAAIASCVLIVCAATLAVPLTLAGVLAGAAALAERRQRSALLSVALASLRATTVRSLALAATGTVALFGNVALGGARNDLLRGIDDYTSHYVSVADIWLVNPGDNQAINDFPADRYTMRLAGLPGVRSVHSFQGSFLDVGSRRMWVIAWPPQVPPRLLEGQLVNGHQGMAESRLAQGGWITVSAQLAGERHLRAGDVLHLSTPSGYRSFRIAALTTNFGWTPGAIVMNSTDYRQAWQTSSLSAVGIDVNGGDLQSIRRQIAGKLGSSSGLEVLTASTRAASIESSAREGLSQLGDISTLLLAAAILAMLAAVGSIIRQRRAAVAALRLEGVSRQRVRRLLLIEVALILLAGCLPGAAAGVYGQLIIDTYLRDVTGFPVAAFATGPRPVEIFALVIATALAAAALISQRASRVHPRIALEH